MSEVLSHIIMMLTGDVMIGRGVDQLFDFHCHPQLHEPWVTDARHYVKLAEAKHGPIPRPMTHAYVWGDALEDCVREKPNIRIINLETSLTVSNAFEESKSIHYRAHPLQVGILRAASIDGCVLANNHIMDFRRDGLEETLKTLKKAHIRFVGAGLNAHDAEEAVRFSLPSNALTLVAWGSVTSGIPPGWQAGPTQSGVNILEHCSLSHILRTLQALSKEGTLPLVSIHGGTTGGTIFPSSKDH